MPLKTAYGFKRTNALQWILRHFTRSWKLVKITNFMRGGAPPPRATLDLVSRFQKSYSMSTISVNMKALDWKMPEIYGLENGIFSTKIFFHFLRAYNSGVMKAETHFIGSMPPVTNLFHFRIQFLQFLSR